VFTGHRKWNEDATASSSINGNVTADINGTSEPSQEIKAVVATFDTLLWQSK